MRKHWLAYSLVGVLLYVLFLVVTAPAAFVASVLAQATKGIVTLTAVNGSVWSGEGEVVVHAAPRPPTTVGQGKWSVNPFTLVLGRAQVALDLTGPAAQGHATVGLGLGATRLSDVDIRFPAAFAETFYAPVALVGPAGDIQFSASALDIARDGLAGSAEMRWLNASSALSSVKPLGDYRLHLSAEKKIAQLKFETLKGDLRVDGNGEYRADSRQLMLNLGVKPSGRSEELEPLLKFLGPDQGQGERRVVLNVPISLF